MSTLVGKTRYVEVRIVDVNSQPVIGLALSDFQVFFTRNDDICSDPLTLVEESALPGGEGRYVVIYTPSTPGHDFLDIYNPVNDIRVQDAEDIQTVADIFGGSSAVVQLTQDYGTVGALKLNVADPQTYMLYVFKASDWQLGLKSPLNAVKSTALDTMGNWVTSPLSVLPNFYTIVAINKSTGAVFVIASSLNVTAPV